MRLKTRKDVVAERVNIHDVFYEDTWMDNRLTPNIHIRINGIPYPPHITPPGLVPGDESYGGIDMRDLFEKNIDFAIEPCFGDIWYELAGYYKDEPEPEQPAPIVVNEGLEDETIKDCITHHCRVCSYNWITDPLTQSGTFVG